MIELATMRRIGVIFGITALCIAGSARADDASALYQRGREEIARGNPTKAAEYLEKAVALKPNDASFRYHLGNVYGQMASKASMFKAMSLAKKAKAEWERAIQLDPNHIPARFSLLEFHVFAPGVAGGSESAALAQAAEIRKRDSIDGHRAYARIHKANEKPDLARQEYTAMVKEQPSSARAHYHYGVYLMIEEKNYRAAADEFQAAARLDPAYMPAIFQIGHVAALSGENLTQGEAMLKKYLAYQPKDDEPSRARTLYWLGAVYEKQGKKAEARSSFASSLAINPSQKDVAEAAKRVAK